MKELGPAATNVSQYLRIQLGCKTVLRSVLWGLQTTRCQGHRAITQHLVTSQKNSIRKILRIKRRQVHAGKLQSCLEWQICSLRRATKVTTEYDVDISQKLHSLKEAWAGHVARRAF